jgi:hypothetical protein
MLPLTVLDTAVSSCMDQIDRTELIIHTRNLYQDLEVHAYEKMNKIKSRYGYLNVPHDRLPENFKNKKIYMYYYELNHLCRYLRIDVSDRYLQLIDLKADILSMNELEEKQVDYFMYFLHALKTFIELLIQMEKLLGLRHPLFRLKFIVIRKLFQHSEAPLLEIKSKIATAVPFKRRPIIPLNGTQKYSNNNVRQKKRKLLNREYIQIKRSISIKRLSNR